MMIAQKISMSRFGFNSNEKEFTVDMAELRHAGDPLGRLYPDSSDQGFIMVSHVSGKELVFNLVNTTKDGEGEIRFWNFELVPGVYEAKIAGARVVIFND